MSIVAVHGPYTFGSRAIAEAGSVVGVVDPANGLKWDFRLDAATTRSNQDFSWAFPPDGTPSPQALADPAQVTYATPGSKTVTLTVTNTAKATVNNKALTNNVAILTFSAAHGFIVGQSVVVTGVDAVFNGTYTITAIGAGPPHTISYAKVNVDVTSAAATGTVTSDSAQYPAAGSYPITITAATGTGPTTGLMSMEGGGGEESTNGNGVYYPSDHTVDEVKAEADRNVTDQAYIQSLLDAEKAGKNRTTLVSYLEGLLTT